MYAIRSYYVSLHILIARSVTPAEYGAVAFLVTTLAILLLLVSFGNEALLIREGGVRSSRALSVSVFAPGFAVLLAAACVIAAGSLERLLTIPGLGRLLLFGLPVLPRITSYNVCYTKLLRRPPRRFRCSRITSYNVCYTKLLRTLRR